MVDFSVDHLNGHGFDPSVCADCPKKEGGVVSTCGLCGCPVGRGMPMDLKNSPPENCVRLEEHAQAGRDAGSESTGGVDSLRDRFSL